MKTYYVYIATNASGTLYTGVTSNLLRRAGEHKGGYGCSFTSKYNIDRVIYAETSLDVRLAIAREKQIKNWRREKKLALINTLNPLWKEILKDPSTSVGTANRAYD